MVYRMRASYQGCPKASTNVIPVIFHGNAGTGVGFRIKGHNRYGGSKQRTENGRYCPVIVTDEFCTSRLRSFCFTQVELAPGKPTADGRKHRTHRAVLCINPDCISVQARYSIKPRDQCCHEHRNSWRLGATAFPPTASQLS
ncbi:hypothetical protein B0O80DRAFT_273323 [Mortierella sp. GBAus27b]|nr:hypothetical protein B0O80DRAFT_273323 [Mortierella sp. GBAus27b]